jgi:hypothetical protein
LQLFKARLELELGSPNYLSVQFYFLIMKLYII